LHIIKKTKNMAKKYCDCGNPASWVYMPGFSDGNSFICEDCISHIDSVGCSCNWEYTMGECATIPEGIEGKDWKWVIQTANEHMSEITIEDGIWVSLDERGRPYPCAEYEYDTDGNNFDWDDEES
jgi:hypothetical protein